MKFIQLILIPKINFNPDKPRAKKKCSLNETQHTGLYKLGLKVDKSFKYPQDIEWAIENNNIYILQGRSITTF